MPDLSTTEIASTAPAASQQVPAALRGHLLRYRVLAYVTGVGLVILFCLGLPLQFWAHNDWIAMYVGIAHGYLYMVYVVLAFVLCLKARWSLPRTLVVVLSGTVPFAVFVVERVYVSRWIRARP